MGFGQFWQQFWELLSGKNIKDVEELQAEIQSLQSDKIELISKIQALNDLLYQDSKSEDDKAKKILDLQAQVMQDQQQLSDSANKIVQLNAAIESLKVELAVTGEIDAPQPDFLDTSKSSYLPAFQYVDPQGQIKYVYCQDPTEVYVPYNFQKKFITDQNLRGQSKHNKLMAIWKWVTDSNHRVYELDYGDNWQSPLMTYVRQKGDCEDSSILFMSFARIAGIRPDQIFLCCGDTSFGYHAYPIVFYTAQEAKDAFDGVEGWYVFESTLSGYCPPKPILITTVKYWVDSIANWKFCGIIKPDKKAQFNGNYTGGDAMENQNNVLIDERKRIDNSKEKQQAIQEYWKSLELAQK